jgi:hypothetical protein
VNCDYCVFVTLTVDNLVVTRCLYVRDRLLADALVYTLRVAGCFGPERYPIRSVEAAKL